MKAILIANEKENKFSNLHGHTFEVVRIETNQITLKGIDKPSVSIQLDGHNASYSFIIGNIHENPELL